MKKILSLLFFAALMVTAFASPPPDQKVQEPQFLSITQAEYQAPAVAGYDSFYTIENIYADQLPENRLMASLSQDGYAPPEETADETNAKNPLLSWESIVGILLLLITTIFGAKWSKWLGIAKEAVALASTAVSYLEDGNLSNAEIKDLKARAEALKVHFTKPPA